MDVVEGGRGVYGFRSCLSQVQDLQYLLLSATLPKLFRAIARNGLGTWPPAKGISTTNQGQPTRACLRNPGRFDRVPQMTEYYE